MLATLVKWKSDSTERRDLFETLMKSSYRQAYGLAYRLTGNSAEAEDLVQETYVRAFRFFARYDEALPFTSWLFRIMTNVQIDTVRRRNRIKTSSLDAGGPESGQAWELPDLTHSPDKSLLETTMAEPVQLALRSINPEFRTAVIMADVEGLAYEEIAELMQISIGTVRSRIHRGRKQLKRHLEQSCPHLVREEVL